MSTPERQETNRIVIHGSYTPPDHNATLEDIRAWHLERGFTDTGYHYVVERDGRWRSGRPAALVGAHAHGANRDSIGICLVGGMPRQGRPQRSLPAALAWDFNYTDDQVRTLLAHLPQLWTAWGVTPEQTIGHRDVPATIKQCPGFDVAAFLGVG